MPSDACPHCAGQPLTRREMLVRCANGFGAVALLAQMAERSLGDGSSASHSLARRMGHHRAKARSVIFLYMDGGPSQVDTFDPKPSRSWTSAAFAPSRF
ncbi:MAG: DUF1501 domain-containing protein [Verrucomicrobia bacterium]|nr:DUF1501 domain-containing protein [Verrucomicrobiota bacterium]